MDVGLVCDVCSTFNPMGASFCARCGAVLSLDETAVGVQGGAIERTIGGVGQQGPPAANPLAGLHLAEPETAGRKPVGYRVQAAESAKPRTSRQTQYFGAMQAHHAKLVLIKGDGADGVSFTLAGEEHRAGRIDTPIAFVEDFFLSPVHANFLFRFGNLVVRDEKSENGVYIRIRDSVPIQFGDRFLVGEQVLEIQYTPEGTAPEPIDDGTYFFASPRRPSYFRVVQALRGGDTGLAYRAHSPTVCIGREGNDIDFPDDPFISGRHARLSFTNKQLSLTDLDSKNGTFLRINGEHVLKHGDYVFMGQQLLRVEIV